MGRDIFLDGGGWVILSPNRDTKNGVVGEPKQIFL